MEYSDAEMIAEERSRILTEYERRNHKIRKDLYAPWQPAENLNIAERRRVAAKILHKLGKFPKRGDSCLEVGYGKLGWLADLLSWGLKESDLHGIELDGQRALLAQQAFPSADLVTGDATSLPWINNTFSLVVVSTVFSSILNDDIRKMVACEIERVMLEGGVLLWYDLAMNNPKNVSVRGVGVEELRALFPQFGAVTKSVTLAPPLARAVASRSYLLAQMFGAIPFLRTHLLGVLVKQ